MKKQKKEVVGFNFQIIPLQNARAMSAAGGGKFAALKEELLARIPELKENESFAFGLPGGKKLEDKEIQSVRMSVNTTLSQMGLPWKIGYNEERKIFYGDYLPSGVHAKVKRPYIKQSTEPTAGPANIRPMAVENFVQLAKKLHPEINLAIHRGPYALARYRSAVCQVGVNMLTIRPEDLAPLVGISASGVYFNAMKGKHTHYVDELKKALEENNQ